MRRGDLARHHPAERVAHERHAVEPERFQQLVVAEDEVPDAVEVVDVLGRLRRRARMLGSVDGEVARQLVEERIPLEAPRAVKEDERGPAALRQHPDADLALPDLDRLLAHARAAATPAALGAAFRERSFSGHQ